MVVEKCFALSLALSLSLACSLSLSFSPLSLFFLRGLESFYTTKMFKEKTTVLANILWTWTSGAVQAESWNRLQSTNYLHGLKQMWKCFPY